MSSPTTILRPAFLKEMEARHGWPPRPQFFEWYKTRAKHSGATLTRMRDERAVARKVITLLVTYLSSDAVTIKSHRQRRHAFLTLFAL